MSAQNDAGLMSEAGDICLVLRCCQVESVTFGTFPVSVINEANNGRLSGINPLI